ncbi:MAG TPA: hypothetical protein V6D23_16055 [Candidatus Obscuribacterales bacterium]
MCDLVCRSPIRPTYTSSAPVQRSTPTENICAPTAPVPQGTPVPAQSLPAQSGSPSPLANRPDPAAVAQAASQGQINPQRLASQTLYPTQTQAQLQNLFLTGNPSDSSSYVYSSNFGIIDREHVQSNGFSMIQVYNAAVESRRTGRPVDITLNGYHTGPQVRVDASQSTDLVALSRQVVREACLRSEDATQYRGHTIGSSAYSTEDLASNAVGFRAAEAYLLSRDPQAANPDPNSPAQQALRQIGPPPAANNGAEADRFLLNWTLRNAGELSPQRVANQAGIEVAPFGNMSFAPRLVPGTTPDPAHSAYLRELGADAHHRHDAGPGWTFTGRDRSMVEEQTVNGARKLGNGIRSTWQQGREFIQRQLQ